MATKKFSSEFDSRGIVKVTDKLIIQNIDTGAVEYTTVAGLLGVLASVNQTGVKILGTDPTSAYLNIKNLNGQEYKIMAGLTSVSNDGFAIRNITSGRDELYIDPNGILYANSLALFYSAGVAYNGIRRSTTKIEYYNDGITSNPANPIHVFTGTSGAVLLTILQGGNIGIGTLSPTSKLQVVGLPEYNDNTNAAASGLAAGAFYRTGDALKVVH